MDTSDNDKTLAAISELAVSVAKGFAEQGERLDGQAARLDGQAARLDRLEKGQKAILEVVSAFSPKGQQKLQETVDEHDKRIKRLETKAA